MNLNILIIFIPFLGFLTCISFGRYLGHRGTAFVLVFGMLVSLFLSLINLSEILFYQSISIVTYHTWVDMFYGAIQWTFLFDTLTSVMLVVVTFISSLVHIYSLGYMSDDPHLTRFMSYLSLFTFFMLMLVTAGNFMQIFLGWEGVGLASYLLINFWFTRLQANKSAIKAVVVNKFGDFALIICIILIFDVFKTLDLSIIFSTVHLVSDQYFNFFLFSINKVSMIGFLLLLGAVGKSAQLGLHTWLPDAMEGPTPVSALIHAATMVTAGVFLLVRCSSILEESPFILFCVLLVGGLTAFFAGVIGLVQNDLKRVIAFSTCSQLGYMVFSCGMSNYALAMFHLSNHAFFKALLFLGAGSVIHAMANEQDMRRMGGLVKILPLTYMFIFIGSCALMGFPFLTGFYSKDVILETVSTVSTFDGIFVYWLGLIAAACTAFYSFRLLYLTFLNIPVSNLKTIEGGHEPNLLLLIPLFLLGFCSIFIGFLSKDFFIGLGSSFWNQSIFVLPTHSRLLISEFIPTGIKHMPLLFTFISTCLAFTVYFLKNYTFLSNFKTSKLYYDFYQFFSKKWYFDNLYNIYIVPIFFKFGYLVGFKSIDQGFVQFFGPRGIIVTISKLSKFVSRFQSGYIYHYSFIMFTGCFILLIILFNNFGSF